MSASAAEEHERKLETVELVVARLLRIGVGIAAVFILVGLVGLVFNIKLEAATLLTNIGLGVLVFTPIMRVVAALLVYWREKDFTYAGISLIVLCTIAVGLLIGKME